MTYASSSSSFNFDYNRIDSDAGAKKSSSFNLIGAVTDISAEGESNSFLLRNIYASQASTSVCGNGLIEGTEQCDGTNLNGLTCASYGYNSGSLSCSSCNIINNCSNSGGGGGSGGGDSVTCGNGLREGGEQCDDGNLLSGDGCSAGCRNESPYCGNGITNIGEECDDGNVNMGDGCTPICTLEIPTEEPVEPPTEPPVEPPTEDPTEELTGEIKWGLASIISEGRFEIKSKEQKKYVEKVQGLRGAASEYFSYHFENFAEEKIITVLDETPFVVTQLSPNEFYEFYIMGQNDEILSRQYVQADENGILKTESIPYLDYKTYSLQILNSKQEIEKAYKITIEDRKYRLHETLTLNNEKKREVINLGEYKEADSKTLHGEGKPGTKYFAYFQSLEKPQSNKVNTIITVIAVANSEGLFEIQTPEYSDPGLYHIDVVQVYDDGKVSRNKQYTFRIMDENNTCIWVIIAIAIMSLIGALYHSRKTKNGFKVQMLSLMIIFGIITNMIPVNAATTTPGPFIYEGKLLDSTNTPIATAHTFRFSLWSSDDLIAGDISGAGAINVVAAAYGGWTETQTVTPNSDGTFFFELGSVTALPDMTIGTHDYLMVEIKSSGLPDTSYEVMDPTGDAGIDTDDRQTIGSTPFANNADFIDNAELGITAGDIATLSVGDIWDINFIPGGTNADTFILDNNDTVGIGGTIDLQFGNALGAILNFDITNSWFSFNNDVNFGQNEIKNVVIDNQIVAPVTPIAGQIYHNTADNNTYIFNGTTWEDITASSGVVTWASIPTRVKNTVLSPEYSNSLPETDGVNNKGKLILDFTDSGGTNKYNFYEWTTRQVGIQDMDIVISYELPLDFASFTATPISVDYQTNDGVITNNKVDASVYDSNGNLITLTGATNLASASWTTANITFGGSPVFTAGTNITLRLKLSSLNAGFARIGDIKINYNGK